MATKSSDKEIVATLTEKLGDLSDRSKYDNENNLISLDLKELNLSQIPPELRLLSNLQVLTLDNNQLTQLPAWIGQLSNLRTLYLYNNQLMQVPPELGQLSNLQTLSLQNNQLTQLPAWIGELSNLHMLSLSGNQLTQLPPELGQLSNLRQLYLSGNQLKDVPAWIGQLTNLYMLALDGIQLTQLPTWIGQLSNLQFLTLSNNQLTQLPPELGQLSNLRQLYLDNNPDLLTPPPEVVTRGTSAILQFLQELQKDSSIRYEAKLLVIGEGGTGKSSLLRSLRNEPFDDQLSTTHGIEVSRLTLPHPQQPGTEMILNTWDFGGQHIYHATHQFFLTKRSLYLVAWNARLGVQQGRLDFWLETIRALAPDAPVMLVATHSDERAPDINYRSYQEQYPQLVGSFSVSNKDGAGLAELKDALARHAAAIRLMGQPWPRRWLEVEQQLQGRPEHHIDAHIYTECCTSKDVDTEVAMGTLGDYLHDLGKMLYFRDDPVLSNFVVLKPNWVTKAISRVLTDEQTRAAYGVLSHAALPRIWAHDDDDQLYEPYLYPVFLRLMERFDLSYQIDPQRPGRSSTQSLVPQLLPYQPPANLPPWPTTPITGQAHVEMCYRFDFVPAGIMPWFIVRTHPYTQNMHWQEGVVLQYQDHQARVELQKRELRLAVWGVQPHNFFTILMHTLESILSRFEGLHVQREVPCICHEQSGATDPCPRFYRYQDLERRMEAGRHEAECPDSFQLVSVPQLLYGIHWSTNEQVIADIRRDQQQLLQGQRKVQDDLLVLPELRQLLNEVNQRSELMWRELIRQWNVELHREEAECPDIIFLTLGKSKRFNPKNWVSQEYRIYLVCQHPPGPHQVGKGYSVREAKEWWITVSPWLNRLITILKIGLPMTKALGDVVDQVDMDQMKNQVALMEEITRDLSTLPALNTLESAVTEPNLRHDQRAVGPALRALHSFLVQADPARIWGGLHKTLTPDGNILWLCDTHRQQYAVKPLDPQFLK
jgi:internalin A